jgi:microcystin-dependent protein
MAEPFLGELRLFSFAFAPKYWALCNGQLLPINQNQALYSLLGNYYGGDGKTTYALPDLRGRTPIHRGGSSGANPGYVIGQAGGEQVHTVTGNEMPRHSHSVMVSLGGGDTANPSGKLLATTVENFPAYASASSANAIELNPKSVANAGGGQPHQNMQPFLTLSFCIALRGIYPTRD